MEAILRTVAPSSRRRVAFASSGLMVNKTTELVPLYVVLCVKESRWSGVVVVK